ncbi:MAG: RNA pseudouridine synthase [Treponema sp.]|jgi:23S rRNA pseudouridine1911/1915/1917 synthase|nr:RNA pseudouridine synthase [Treponema sp.]
MAPHRDAFPRRIGWGLSLLYEDRDIIVVDKPAGLLSIAAGSERDRTAYWALAEYLRKKGEKRRPAVVHRLDRETSGLLLFAKSERIKRTLMDHWTDLVTGRRYIALTEGDLRGQAGTLPAAGTGGWSLIDAPLGTDRGGHVRVSTGGTPARTWWRLLGYSGGYSRLELELETGRRNQIRAHLAWLGCPVAGDSRYGASIDPQGRLALHAETLVFRHPAGGRSGGQVLEFRSPAPF